MYRSRATSSLDMCLWYSTLREQSRYMAITNDDFNIIDEKMYLWQPLSCKEEYQFVHWCVNHNFSRAAINKLFMNRTMAFVSNCTLSHTEFKWFNIMFYSIGIDSWKLGKVCYNHLSDSNNLHIDDYTPFFYHNRVGCIVFLKHQPLFREDMLYAPSKVINNVEE